MKLRLKNILKLRLTDAGTVVYPITLRPDTKPGEQGRFRQYQLPFVHNNRSHTINVSPTGSGKSVMMLARAAKRYFANKSTVIIVPKHGIASTIRQYTNGGVYNFTDGEEKYYLPKGCIVTPESSTELLDSLEHDYLVSVCCYQTFIKAYDKLSPKAKKNLLVSVDEAHHSSTENTQLGKLVDRLHADNVQTALWTATAYRADNSDLIDAAIKDKFHVIRRTLIDHFKEGECPDFNIHFKLYEHIDNKQAEDYRITNGVVKIGSIDALLDAYVEQFMKSPRKQTLMVIPGSMVCGGKTYSAAKACHILELRLRKAWPKGKTLNIVQLGSRDGKNLVTENPSVYRKQFDRLGSDEHIHAVIAINSMDEGVDWPDCCQTFIPRVPSSIVRTMQLAIGRAMRRPKNKRHPYKKWNGHCWGASDVWFFEIGIDLSHEDEIAPAVLDLAARIKCLCYGVEFRAPIELVKVRNKIVRDRLNAEKQRLTDLGPVVLSQLQKQLIRMANHDRPRDEFIDAIREFATEHDISISEWAAFEFLAEIGITDPNEVRKLLSSKRVQKLLKANDTKNFTAIFDEVKSSLTVDGTADVIGVLTDSRISDREIRHRLLDFYPTMAEATAACIRFGIKTQQQYNTRYKEDSRLPSVPHQVYSSEWQGMMMYLTGKIEDEFYQTMDEATRACQALRLRTVQQYNARYKEDSRLPSAPQLVYQKEWNGWRYFLTGAAKTNHYSSWNLASDAARSFDILSAKEYRLMYKLDDRLPCNPDRLYPDWPGWVIFLGSPRRAAYNFYSTLGEAKAASAVLGITSWTQYCGRYKEDPRLPSNPHLVYESEWVGRSHFLGKATKPKVRRSDL